MRTWAQLGGLPRLVVKEGKGFLGRQRRREHVQRILKHRNIQSVHNGEYLSVREKLRGRGGNGAQDFLISRQRHYRELSGRLFPSKQKLLLTVSQHSTKSLYFNTLEIRLTT